MHDQFLVQPSQDPPSAFAVYPNLVADHNRNGLYLGPIATYQDLQVLRYGLL